MYDYADSCIVGFMSYSLHQQPRTPYLRTAIVGVSGFAGLQLLRLLGDHPVMAVSTVCASSQAGEPLDVIWPHLAGLPAFAGVVAKPSTVEALEGHDVVFLATPHEAAAELAGPLVDLGALVVDVSGGHRLNPEAMTQWYGFTHPRPDLLPAVYGLPELVDVRGARLIAGPGCYPTATLVGLAPFLDVIDPATISVTGMSGISGAGRAITEPLSYIGATQNTRAYGAPGHRHTAEIERILGELAGWAQPPIRFTPHIVPQISGLLCTTTVNLTDPTIDPLARLHDHYGNQPFIHVADGWPETKAVVGSNRAAVYAKVDARTGSLLVSCAIDNTIKGAAGQVIQAANIALGLDQTLGLPHVGMYL